MIHLGLKLGDIFVSQGLLSQEQLQSALEYAQRRGCMLGEALVALRLVSETDVARALAEQNGLRFVDLYESPPAPEAVRLLPRDTALDYRILPIRVEGSRLVVAAHDPFDLRIDEAVRKATGMGVMIAAVADGQLRDLLSRYDELAVPASRGAARAERERATSPRRGESPARQSAHKTLDAAGTGGSHKLDTIIADVVSKHATDLYVEPEGQGLRVCCRIDGQIHPVAQVPGYRQASLLKRLHALAGANTEISSGTATGTCHVRLESQRVVLQTTIVAEEEGIFAAIRLSYPDETPRPLDSLGMEAETLRDLRRLLLAREGLVLVAGPVGSGKPTTLNALLSHLSSSGVQVVPVEAVFGRKLTSVSQVQTAEGAKSVAAVLAAILSQQPDAVLVPELPDREAAEIACRAGATGQLVLAGSLSSNAYRAMNRMMDLGVPAHQAAGALAAILSQRLLRRVCETCAEPYELPADLEAALRARFAFPPRVRFMKGAGCPDCHSLGTRGCIGVFELLEVDDDLRFMLAERVHPSVIQEHLTRRHFRDLEDDAFRKACRGLISPDEILRLGMSVAAAHDERTLDGAPEAAAAPPAPPEVPLFEIEVGDPEPEPQLQAAFETEPDLEDWGAVAEMAELLRGESLSAGATAPAVEVPVG